MLKVFIFLCICTLLLVEAASGPPGGGPPDGGPPGGRPPQQLNRMTRQAPPGGNGPIPEGMNGGMGPGNLGMQGLGNLPDPTVLIAKVQEMASQFAKGRRRRQAPQPQIPGRPQKQPMPKMFR